MSFDFTTRFVTWAPTRGRVGHEKVIDTKRDEFDAALLAISNQQSAISNQQSAISNQQSAISNLMSLTFLYVQKLQIIKAEKFDEYIIVKATSYNYAIRQTSPAH